MRKKLLLILLAVTVPLSLTACWDHVEISKMLIVAGVGLDVDDKGETYHATVEIVNVESDGGKNISAEIVEGDGSTMHSAIQNAMLMTGGEMFSNHCKVIVIGDKLARKGINEVIDIILRSPNFRKTVDIMVAKDAEAQSILKQKTVKSDIVSYELSKILKSNIKSQENTIATGVYQIHEILVSDCAYFVAPPVFTRKNNGDDVLQVEGCAVFTGDKLQGFLDGEQSKLFNIVTRKAGNMTIQIEKPALSLNPIDLKITKSGASLTPNRNGEVLSVDIAVAAEASLERAMLLDMDLTDSNAVEHLRRGLNEQLSADIKKLISDVQYLYGADIFEFYREYEDNYRQEWAGLKQDWGSHFRTMEVNVVSNIRITGSGLVENYTKKTDGRNHANALP